MVGRSRLFKPGYISLLVVQFFGAANDNLLKGVLSFAVASGGVWASQLGDGGQSYVALCLTIPFILLSGFAGQLADRTSKQKVTVIVKVAEIGIALVGLTGFWVGNLWLAMSAMILLAIQSTFFGPAKYGMIPELVDDEDLSQANGTINMATNIAVIVGTLAAGPVYGWYYPELDPANPDLPLGDPKLWVPGVAMMALAILGLGGVLFMPKLKAMDPNLKIDWNPFRLYVISLREMSKTPLLIVALAWAFFYMIGMMAILILPDYKDLLGVSATKASILLGILGVSIGVGSVLAGLISGKHIEPRMIPVGAIGMTIFFALLGTAPLKFGLVGGFIAGAGFFAGFYIVPLQALLQHLAPDNERGRFLGTANALSFVMSTVGSLLFLFARKTLEMPSNKVFLICAGLALVGSGFLLYRMRTYLKKPAE